MVSTISLTANRVDVRRKEQHTTFVTNKTRHVFVRKMFKVLPATPVWMVHIICNNRIRMDAQNVSVSAKQPDVIAHTYVHSSLV